MIQRRKLYIVLILIIVSIFAISPSQALASSGGGTTAIQDGIESSSVTKLASDPITNPNAYKPGGINSNDANAIASKAGLIFDTITTIGIVVAVITILVIGIKYMVGSVEEKAEYKKTMIPYIIGVVMLLGISAILQIISGVVENIK